ncbi:hypothetical protein N798_05210 [Knoellia flava TL1]|uniref:DUF1700 domain-containing protein n=2 Tax=Knoellia flava TaxID=913969 RepID=A0A8H9FTH2_9MICO|nr:hypothetical protein [Knoellia flava]KGN34043.1 hypothetical protein N798_05210 [Knoellia flava TL1]GGB83413.1 hypothetical protein GCM10011314_23810 [Knoellia flava]
MTPATTHPLVAAWLRDLELMLHGVEPGERAEVLAGVHEHLDATLPPGSTDADVRRVLADLGSPESVADEAYAGRPPLAVTPSHPGSPLPAMVAVAVNALCIVLLLLPVLFGALHAAEILMALPIVALPWVVVSVLTATSTRWTSREKAAAIGLLPATILALSLVVWLMMALIGPHIVNLVPTLAILGTASWVLVRLGRSALR